MKVYVLVVGTTFATCQIGAKAFKNAISNTIQVTELHYGSSRTDFVNGVKWINDKLINEECLAITYYTGHGNIQGNREYYQFPEGPFYDTDFDQAVESHLWHPNSLLLAISDCCSCGVALDMETSVPASQRHRWMTVSGTNQVEDAFIDSDGGIFTQVLVANLHALLTKQFKDWSQFLEQQLADTWIGQLQHVTVQINSSSIDERDLRSLLNP